MIDLFQPGAYCRSAGGNIEQPQIQQPVVRWMSWSINPDNGGEGAPIVWRKAWDLWTQWNILHFPWLHVHTMDDIQRLIDIGKQHQSPAIGLNLEDVVADFTSKGITLADIAQKLEQWPLPIHMATLPWVQNGQGWAALKRCVAAIEIFPDENEPSKHPQACIQHAFDEGLTQVAPIYKTKAPNTPETYDLTICHSLYTADDIPPTAEEWNKWKAPIPCQKLQPPDPPVPTEPWYKKPYLTGPAVGPEKLPRPLYPPSAGKGTASGDDVMAFKRAISRAGRQLPWSPSTWTYTYGEAFAMGDGSGTVAKSGVRGFQRQQWPNDSAMQTGNMGDKTYQAIRRALVSDPESPNFKQPLLDGKAIELLRKALAQYNEEAKIAAWREALVEFCERSEDASAIRWTYSQDRPYSGLGVAPEKMHRNDCSSYVILAYYWANQHSDIFAPDPSDYNYNGHGNTWDDLDGSPTVFNGNYLVGDLAHYDGHVTICKKAGTATTSLWSSFGSEPKPDEKTLHYRSDFVKVVRPPLK